MDAAVEALAADQFKADSGPEFVWACREKFLDGSNDLEAATAATALTGTYRLEGRADAAGQFDALQASDAREEKGKTRPPDTTSAVLAPGRANSEGNPDAGATSVVEGRLHVMESGCYVTISGDELLVRKKKREVFRIPVSDLATVYLEGKGLALSADLTMRLCDKDIPVMIMDIQGW